MAYKGHVDRITKTDNGNDCYFKGSKLEGTKKLHKRGKRRKAPAAKNQ